MKKRFWVALLACPILYLTYGVFLSRFDLEIIADEIVADNPNGYYDYKGVTNVHTLLSTGSGSLEEIIAAAQDSGLDFIFITDLNQYEKPLHQEGYFGNLLVFIDGEYSYLDSRLLNLDAQSASHLQGRGRSQALFADLLSQKNRDANSGVLVLSHPFKPKYGWTGEYPPGLDGIEIINLRSIWESAFAYRKFSFLWTLLVYPFNTDLSFTRLITQFKKETKLWDKLSAKRPTTGWAGSDAEARLKFFNSGHVKIPSYKVLFGIATNHVLLRSELTGSYADDRKKIAGALKAGQFYLSFDMLANPKGFKAEVIDQGRGYLMGSQIKFQKGQRIEITLPQRPKVPFETVVIKNGSRWKTGHSRVTSFTLDGPGNYRVMVRVLPTLPLPDGRKWMPWIFTNHFHLN